MVTPKDRTSAEMSRSTAWLLGLPPRKRALFMLGMAAAVLGAGVPFGVSCWRAASADGRLALVVAWLVLFAGGVVAGLKARQNARTGPLDADAVRERVQARQRRSSAVGVALLAFLAVASSVTGRNWKSAFLAVSAAYAVPAFVLMATGFWQRGSRGGTEAGGPGV